MSEKSDVTTRRSAFSFIGFLLAASSLAVLPSVLTASDAEAQTAGMVRRQHRRTGRRLGRYTRRAYRRGY